MLARFNPAATSSSIVEMCGRSLSGRSGLIPRSSGIFETPMGIRGSVDSVNSGRSAEVVGPGLTKFPEIIWQKNLIASMNRFK
jgi:hypothetical protein